MRRITVFLSTLLLALSATALASQEPAPLPGVAPLPAVAPLPGVAPIPAMAPTAAPAPPPPGARLPSSHPSQRDSRTKRVSASVTLNGRELALIGNAMDLSVSVGSSDEATLAVELEFWSDEEAWMNAVQEEFDIEVVESGGRVELWAAELPDAPRGSWLRRFFGGNETTWAMDAELTVPSGTRLDIENRYGDIAVRDIAGALEVANTSGSVTVRGSANTRIDNQYGPIEVRRVSGNLRINGGSSDVTVAEAHNGVEIISSYGSVEVEDVTGALRVDVSSGELKVDGVAGDADLSNTYGMTVVRDVQGDLELRTSSGDVQIEGVTGRLRAEGSYAPMTVADIGGAAELSMSSGAVTLSRTGGAATIRNSYAPVRAVEIGGDLRVEGASSHVTANEIAGEVDITTSYDSIVIRGVEGAVRVRNQSGRVEITELRGAALQARHTIETSYANIDLEWPDAAAPQIQAECTYGRIRSDFDGNLRETGSGQRFSATGTGGAALRLVTSSGSITLRRR